tara:strand:- start:474 stop:959 length:486 start_codon:yes stop_codon:yes gene_type:complete
MSWITCNFSNGTQAYKDGKTFLVSPDDYEDFVDGYRFGLSSKGHVMYSGRKDGLNGKRLHRIIMGEPEDFVIDHINRDLLDNRSCNLGFVSQQENVINRGIKKTNKSGVSGVSWHKRDNKWVSQITYKNKKIHLGNFDTLEEATKAREDGKIKYFGEFRAM